MLFHIIVPMYNAAPWIERNLAMVRNQSCPDFRCVVLDDLSTDDSVACVRRAIAGDPRFTLLENDVKHYSMGMRTRLAFAICAHVEAEILVVDEALAVGDAAFQRKCLDWIDSFRKEGTLLFVSHSTAEEIGRAHV